MSNIPDPIFKNRLSKISWKKIYDREYGVQYSEVAVRILSTQKNHFPNPSQDQIVIPGEGSNTTFYIDDISWINLVEGLNKKDTSVKGLEEYEKQFFSDGKNYVNFAKEISKLDLKNLSNEQLLSVFIKYKEKQDIYSVFAWSAFILNNYIADKAISLLEPYIKKHHKENDKDLIIEALFKPEKLAAVLQLQHAVETAESLTEKEVNNLYEKFKWLSCLDIQNNPWSKNEFREHIKAFTKQKKKDEISFEKILKELNPSKPNLEYLHMAKKFVYIKDARDDYRREGVFYAGSLYKELASRMGIVVKDTSFLLDQEIISFLKSKEDISKEKIQQRKKGFIMYMDKNQKIICLQGDQISAALKLFNVTAEDETVNEISGRVASIGLAKGKVVIIKGVKDLAKIKTGQIMVAVTTHPDFVPAMRKAAAIVTDEGGITSHAAIVSREFGIPCIVGAKIATKVLKDGDMVEVDANSGIVKKI